MTSTGQLRITVATGARVLSSGDVLTVGRDPGQGLTIDDPLVSRAHLRIAFRDRKWRVEDLATRNGTFCNGQRIDTLVVDAACEIRLGQLDGPRLVLDPVVDPLRRATPGVVRIGRDPGSDLVLDDLLVSRHHAELRAVGASLELVDLDSHNGTYLNGHRVYRSEIHFGDLVSIGGHALTLTSAGLTEAEPRGGVAYAASGLRVTTKQGKVILDGISFALDESSFLGVIGPSGSGKSTLVNALTGFRPANEGTVFYSGRDLYAEYEHLRQLIGYVPQDDVLHLELTIGQTLEYAARLRFPPDVTKTDREARIAEVLDELGLSERADVAVANLSGGQRKRVSVALELLTRPSLLILDEPTSGLDPGYERSLMELLATLAAAGRTVIVVTHSVQSLHLCDRILCLAPGGRMGWFGPSSELTGYFSREDYQEVFRDLSLTEGDVWKQRFEAHPDYGAYVTEPLARYEPAAGPRKAVKVPRWDWFRQFSVLTHRSVASLLADRRTLGMLFGLAIGLALILLVALPQGELGKLELPEVRLVSQAPLVLLTLVLGVTELGAFNAIRAIAEELPLYRRERAVGLSISAYVASKTVVLGAITVIQAVILGVIATARQGGPEDAVIFGWPLGEFLIILALVGLAAMGLGLMVSAAVNTVDRAMTLLPVIFIMMMVLASGGVFPDFADQPGLKQASYLASSQWGFAGAAVTADLNELNVLGNIAGQIPIIDVSQPEAVMEVLLDPAGGPARYSHDAATWLAAVAALLTITAGTLVATALLLRRHD